MKKFWCVLFFVFFIGCFCVFAHNQSDTLFEQLHLLHFTPQKELLQNSPSTQFPYNILLNFKGTNNKTLYLIFSQTEALANFTELTPFLLFLQTKQHHCNTVVVFTTNNESLLPESLGYREQGIQTFFSKITSTDTSAAVILEITDNTKQPTTLSLGGNKKITPPWLVSLVSKSFNAAQEPFSIQDSSLSLYRMGLIESSNLLGYLLQHQLPALSITVSTQNFSKILSCAEIMLENFNQTEIGSWDSQYSIVSIPFFNRTFFVSEKFYIVGILIFGAAALCFLFLFSFFIGKNAKRRKRDFFRTWFLLPLLLFINIVLLYLSQNLTTLFFPLFAQRPLITLLFKGFYFVVFTALLSFLLYLVKLPFSFYIYGFLQTIAAFLLIIFFGILDLSLVPYCMIFYVIVYLSRMMKKLIPLILVFLLMLIPFEPILHTIIRYGSKELLQKLVLSPFHINILFAVFFIPFQFMWLRILQQLEFLGKGKIFEKKKFIIEVTAISCIFFVLTSSLIIINSVLKKELPEDTQNRAQIHLSSSTQQLAISEKCISSFNNNNFECTIASPEQVIRFDITIKGTRPLPLYDANFPFDTFEKENSALFYLDENPPNPLVLQFTTALEEKITLIVTAYIKQAENRIEKITLERNLGIAGENN